MRERQDDLELMGLAAGERVTHEQLRRAYLRRLRAHPPERDPEGFRRLREAFERLEPAVRLHEAVRAAAAEHARAAAPASDAGESERCEPPAEAHREVGELPPAIVVKLGDWGRAAAAADPPVSEPRGASPATLSDLTEQILALLHAGKIDAARDLARRWKASELDDHREVSALDAQRWALTRDLVNVARALPDSLRRSLAHGIEDDDLTAAYAAAESYQERNPTAARDLVKELAKRGPNLHKVLGPLLLARAGGRDTSDQSSGFSFRLLWVALVAISALVRATGSCDDHRRLPELQNAVPQWEQAPPPWPGPKPLAPPQPDPDRQRWFERTLDRPTLDPPTLDPPTLDGPGRAPSGERGSVELLDVRPGGEAPPSPR